MSRYSMSDVQVWTNEPTAERCYAAIAKGEDGVVRGRWVTKEIRDEMIRRGAGHTRESN